MVLRSRQGFRGIVRGGHGLDGEYALRSFCASARRCPDDKPASWVVDLGAVYGVTAVDLISHRYTQYATAFGLYVTETDEALDFGAFPEASVCRVAASGPAPGAKSRPRSTKLCSASGGTAAFFAIFDLSLIHI